MIKEVVKSNGKVVPFDPDKLNTWAQWADKIGLDWSNIALQAFKKCHDGCTTRELQQAMIDACRDKKDEYHLMLAGRLLIGNIYKEAFGGHDKIPSLSEFYKKMTGLGFWEYMDYSEEDLEKLNALLDHERDLNVSYTELSQLRSKYLIMDRVANKCYESPQFMYMGMAMKNMEREPKDRRLEDVAKLFQYLSEKKINAPTPFMVNLRTPKRGYASCCVSTTLDSAASLAAADHINYMMTCASAGIGAHHKTRSQGDAVRQGQIKHQGKLPYYRMVVSAVNANVQSSRGGAATTYFNMLDPEVEDLLLLKSPTTVVQRQIRGMDYSFGANRFFAKKAAKKGTPWMLISVAEAEDLYDAMYDADEAKFAELYDKYDKDPNVKKRYVDAQELLISALTQRVETGRIYEHFTDRMNAQTPFLDTIWSSNLCAEIGLPTKGFPKVTDLYDPNGEGEIGLCSLSAIVAGRVSEEEYYSVAYYTLKMVDNVIELMDYPFPQLERTAKARRSIGIGITNLAYAMAKGGYSYSSEEGKNFVHRLAELHSYSLHKASLQLAKEKGVCEWINKTKYPQGWFPHDDAVEAIDTVHSQPLLQDWETLRKEIVDFGGIRHSVLEAHMPCESSSVASNTLNGLYPVRGLKVSKGSGKEQTNVVIVPEYDELKDRYELAWDVPTRALIEVYGIVQKFTGQGISADYYRVFKQGEERKVSAKELVGDYLYAIKMGHKTAYYLNSKTTVTGTNTGLRDEVYNPEETDDADCVACKL